MASQIGSNMTGNAISMYLVRSLAQAFNSQPFASRGCATRMDQRGVSNDCR